VLIRKKSQQNMTFFQVREAPRMGDMVGKPEGKRPLGRPSRRWECTIRINLKEMGEP
jgi:hypothetical protein